MDVSINSTGFLLQQQKHHLGFIWMTTGGSEEFKKITSSHPPIEMKGQLFFSVMLHVRLSISFNKHLHTRLPLRLDFALPCSKGRGFFIGFKRSLCRAARPSLLYDRETFM